MKQLVLKVPTGIFAVFVLAPLFIIGAQIFSEQHLTSSEYFDYLKISRTIVILLWLFSIVDYFKSKVSDFEQINLIYTLLFFGVGLEFADWLYFWNLSVDNLYYWIIEFLQLFNHIALTVFLTRLVKKFFKERSTWFIVIEFFTVVVGVLTLTPEIKRYEQGVGLLDKNEG